MTDEMRGDAMTRRAGLNGWMEEGSPSGTYCRRDTRPSEASALCSGVHLKDFLRGSATKELKRAKAEWKSTN